MKNDLPKKERFKKGFSNASVFLVFCMSPLYFFGFLTITKSKIVSIIAFVSATVLTLAVFFYNYFDDDVDPKNFTGDW